MITCQTRRTHLHTATGSVQIFTNTQSSNLWKEKKERKGEKDTKEIHVMIQMANKNNKIFSTSLVSK